ncbi:probable E3 ubiquitin-protein ligase HERC4 [Protobothrops mucrosquamatus]|uniref:probable E3 ubiquitin-protein ligase HERC4 n=1 Tax=Protobothrops mucrosquamatus TaxID=103944 RepID=UPI0007756592|nr:probable E3 ubiquitin-protein ligase HERC4 [Protobothrops mucrosquamatus]
MPGAGKRRPGGATSSPGGSLSRPTRSLQKPGKKVAEKMPERRAGAEGSDRLSSPAVSSPPLRAPLLLFPRVGYHRSIFKEDPEAIRQISCKQGYLAMAQTPNAVQLFGRAQDERHQPALVKNRRSICLKEKIKINSLDCEASHLLILSSNGKLSEYDITTQTPQIRLLKELGNKYIVQIACGDHHSMALSKGGELFAWGENEHGQLGVEKKMGHIKEPQLVLALEGIPLIMIAAGSAHSMVVSIFGTVYSWGKNTFGQLGLGDTEDRYIPAQVKALEHKKTVFISCGGEHTAVLSKDGLVCTFGSGCYGQLGHNSTCNELFPRLVAELFGAQVTQVACGRWHTLVYVPALGEVYAFGYGGEGQLGEGRTSDQLVPLPLDLDVRNKHMKYRSTLGKVVKIIAGDNQSIVLHLEEKNAYANVTQTLATVEEEKFAKWLSNLGPSCWDNIQWNIKLIFSSAACINGSFLHQREEKFRTFEETVGVDMSAVLLFFEKIASKPKVFTKVKKALKSLLDCPLYTPTSPEALRFFLIVPVLLQKQDSDSDHLLCQLAKAIWNLPQQGKQALETLWSNLEVDFFKDLVSMFQRLIGVNMFSYYKYRRSLRSKKNDYIIPLEVFQMLHQVNCRSDFKIQESNFYVPEVRKIILYWIDAAFSYDFNLLWDPTYDIRLALSEFCQFPLILNLEDKIVIHKVKCTVLHMEYTMKNTVTSTMDIRRQYLLQDTLHYLRSAEESCFQHFFTVHFEGELGTKYGGLIQEFFTIISRQLCSPEAQVFKHFEDSNRIWFSHEVSTQDDIYFLIGNLFGIALHNLMIIALPFPLALFKKLANIEPTLEDLKELSPTVGRTLQNILDERYDDNLKNMMLDFTTVEKCKGSISEVNLKENGANIPVTSYNRKEYVDAYVNYIFNESVKKQFGDFVRGFQRGCPSTTWKMFLPVELRGILFGNTAYQWDQLEKNVKYRGFEESDETIKNFWTVFYDFPEESKKDFLAFLTGTVHIPGETMDNFSITIADVNQENQDQLLPMVHTCHQTLFLPRYTDKHILTKKLLDAIENFRDFGLA